MAGRFVLLMVTALFSGCSSSVVRADDVRAIVRKCGLEGQLVFELIGMRDLRIVHLDPKTDYRKVDCFLQVIEPLGLDLGLVRKEAAAPK